jgi:Tol biopolymer transport system component
MQMLTAIQGDCSEFPNSSPRRKKGCRKNMRTKRIFLFLTVFVSVGAFGQKGASVPGDLSPIFDLSPDGKSIVLSVMKGENAVLYLFSLTDHQLTPLTDAKGYYARPVYSPKGDEVVFLSKGSHAETSMLCSINLQTKQVKQLTDDKLYVTEAAFLPDGKGILLCGAGAITNYSPMARRAPHDLDLYSIGRDGSQMKRLTNFHAYQLSGISPNQKGDTILFGGAEGIYLLSLADTIQTKVEAVNNPRPEIGEAFYGTPAYSVDHQQISFIAPYQLYVLNLNNKKCEEVWSSFGKDEQAMPIFSRFNGADHTLIFSVLRIVNRQYTPGAQLYSVDPVSKKATPLL